MPALEFVVGGATFLVLRANLREVALLPELFTLQNMPPVLCGFYPAAHALLPVLHVALLLGLPVSEATSETSILFCRECGPEGTGSPSIGQDLPYGLLVDEVIGFRSPQNAFLDSAPEGHTFRSICPKVWIEGDLLLPLLNPAALVPPAARLIASEWAALAEKEASAWGASHSFE